MSGKSRVAGRDALGEPTFTRRQIQEAAKKLIASQGYAATTVRQIAKSVSMKGGSLYYHFGGKEEILFSILDEGNRRLLDVATQALATEHKNALDLLRRVIREHIRILAQDPAQFMVVTRELERLRGARRQRIIAQRDRYEGIIEDILAKGIKEGSIRPCDVRIATFSIIALLNGVAYWYRPAGRLSIERIADECSRLLLEGLKR